MLYTSAKIGNRKRTTNIVCWCWGKHVMNDIENSLKQKTKTKENTCGFSYDAYGRPVSCGNDIHEQSIVYDKVGNIASVTEQIDGLTFAKSITYDKKGRPESTTSPTGLNIRLNYDPYSNVDAIQCDGKEF